MTVEVIQHRRNRMSALNFKYVSAVLHSFHSVHRRELQKCIFSLKTYIPITTVYILYVYIYYMEGRHSYFMLQTNDRKCDRPRFRVINSVKLRKKTEPFILNQKNA